MREIYPLFIFHAVICLLPIIFCVKSIIKAKYLTVNFLTYVFLAAGSVIMILGILLNEDKLILTGLFFPIGFWFIAFSIISLVKRAKCIKKTDARYVEAVDSLYRGQLLFSPVFRYEYNGRKYIEMSFSMYRAKKLNSLFCESPNHQIFIHPKHPEICTDKARFPFLYVIILVLGCIISALGIFLMIL